jgi:hypothetical protein
MMKVSVSPTSLRKDPDSTSEKIRDLAINTRVKVISPVENRWIHIEVPDSNGEIAWPGSDAQVRQEIEVRISASNLQAETYLGLAVRKRPFMWPKGFREVKDLGGSWSVIIDEGDDPNKGTPSGGEFELVLLEVGSASYKELNEWYRIGAALGPDTTGDHFPGFRRIKDSRELHAIKLRKWQPK